MEVVALNQKYLNVHFKKKLDYLNLLLYIKIEEGYNIKKNIYCPHCQKRLGVYEEGASGIIYLWCKKEKKEIKINIGEPLSHETQETLGSSGSLILSGEE